MKQRIITILTLILIGVVLIGTPVFAIVYQATYTVTSNSTTAYDMLGVRTDNDTNNLWMANNGFMNSTANDTRIETLGGLIQPHMVVDNATLTAIPVPANSQTNLYFTTGNSELDAMDIIPGYGGYVTVADSPLIEIGANFIIEQGGHWDTSFSGNRTGIHKPDAFRTYISGTENITSAMGLGSNLSHAANDHCVKAAAVVMPSGANLTVEAWVYFDGLGVAHTMAHCGNTGVGQYWYLHKNAANKIIFNVSDLTGAAMAAQWTSNNAVVATTWYLITATYNADRATETAVYINGAEWAGVDGGTGLDIWQSNIQLVTGAHWNGGGYIVDFVGDLDEIRISDTCRTLAEHQANYNGGDGFPFEVDANTVTLWHFDEGAGNPVDIAGNNDLVNTGAAWVYTSPVSGGEAATVTASGVSSGAYTVTTTANITHMWIDLDGVTQETIALGGVSVPNNANDWELYRGNLPYADNTTITVNGTLQLWFEPNDMIAGDVLPDRQGGDNPGTFVWGANPTGVIATLGGMVSAGQPSPGLVIEDPTPDIMPGVEVTDWYIEPDVGVGGTLLTNPMRPFVTILSDTTTLTELQAWRILGTALLLLVIVGVAKATRGHVLITGIMGAVAIIGLVALTIYPTWTLVFIGFVVVAEIIAERTPSV